MEAEEIKTVEDQKCPRHNCHVRATENSELLNTLIQKEAQFSKITGYFMKLIDIVLSTSYFLYESGNCNCIRISMSFLFS